MISKYRIMDTNTDYYDEMPDAIRVIDGMNKELSDVQEELSVMKNKYETIIVEDKWDKWIEFYESLPNKLRGIISPNLYKRSYKRNTYSHRGVIGSCTCHIVSRGDKSHLFKKSILALCFGCS